MNDSGFSYSQFMSVGEQEDAESCASRQVSTSSLHKINSMLQPMPLPQGNEPKLAVKKQLKPNEPPKEKKFVEMVMKQQKRLERELLKERMLNSSSNPNLERPVPKVNDEGFIDYQVDFL